ncbi:MAG: hypothetical protein WDO73_20525 [Ignavibacteriota bacterium]
MSGESTTVRLSFSGEADTRRSRAILAELGWKLTANGESYSLEAGDRAKDGARQWALPAWGWTKLTLRQAVLAKREFTFEIPHENARLVGGAAWGLVLKDVPDMPGGPAEAFIRDWRFARVYRGLGALDRDTAAA